MENSIDFGTPGQAGAPADLIKDATEASFVKDVIDASQDVPVIVDFWATWCEPCKQFGPMLEKAVREAKGAVRLVKVDIDANQQIAQQLRIQSVPMVYAFYKGRPVDGFQGAVPESQIKIFIDKLIATGGGGDGGSAQSPVAGALEQADGLLDGGDHASAAAIYGQIVEHEPDNAGAAAGLLRCHMAAGDTGKARAMADGLDDKLKAEAPIAAALSALELAEKSAAAGNADALRRAVEADQNNHQARLDLALVLFAAGGREAAIDELIEIIRRDREWNDNAARTQLFQFFDVIGPADEVTVTGRRKLSSLLFS